MNKFSQAFRMGRLSTVLGPDVLVLERFSGSEQLNDLFDWQVDCLASVADLDFDALIGTHATVTLETRNGTRPFDGIVTEARWLGAGENGHRYRLRLRPWFWLASLRRNQRIFHNKTVVTIVQELLSTYAGTGALVLRLSGSYPELEYTVQYRESDMAFACRMLERHGISYHFSHAEGGHDMVLSDMVEHHESIGARPFHPDRGHHQEDVAHFWDWRPARRITTGAIRLTDYNFKTPKAAMEVDRSGDAAHDQGQIESFDWPGDYLDQTSGKVVAQLRTEAERGQDSRFEAEGDVVELGAGGCVTLSGDAVPGLGAEYLCLGATHSYTSDNYGTGGDGDGDDGFAYTGHYVLMPVEAPMLPERKTARADVRGPQTAVVVGEGEIDCDEFGRILLRFHWDLDGAWSMRCRVAQNWSGNGWGGMVIPRVGMEVLVEFLDGDPDKPLVTGCVYNGRNKVPYELPRHKTRSTFRTDTHQGTGFNELRFEDANGEEEIYVHAQKDRNTVIENDDTKLVGRNAVSRIKGGLLSDVDKSAFTNIDGSLFLDVGSLGKSASANMARSLDGIELKGFAAGFNKKYMGVADKGEIAVSNSGNFILTSGQSALLNAGQDFQIVARKSMEVSTSTHLRMSASLGAIMSAKKFLKIKSNGTITIGNGRAYITLHEDGAIEITGKSLAINVQNSFDARAHRINLN